jgi:hypothetical protein
MFIWAVSWHGDAMCPGYVGGVDEAVKEKGYIEQGMRINEEAE